MEKKLKSIRFVIKKNKIKQTLNIILIQIEDIYKICQLQFNKLLSIFFLYISSKKAQS